VRLTKRIVDDAVRFSFKNGYEHVSCCIVALQVVAYLRVVPLWCFPVGKRFREF
jgi:hypothetical protein